jgi:hypothetical protein
MAEGGTSQNTEAKQRSGAHSPTSGGQVRTQKKSDQVRGTYQLERVEGVTSQDTEKKQQSEAYSQTGDGRRRNKSEHGNEVTEQGTLTNWRW